MFHHHSGRGGFVLLLPPFPREIEATPRRILFRSPTRLASLGFVVLALVPAAFALVFRAGFPVNVLSFLMSGFFALSALRLAWLQCALCVDLEKRVLAYHVRTPLRRTSTEAAFEDIASVFVDGVPNRHGTTQAWMGMEVRGKGTVVFGIGDAAKGRELAARLCDLTGAKLDASS